MKYTAIQYFENKKKGVIVAKTTVTELVDGAPIFPKEIRAKAKCSPEDRYDYKFGKKLATLRLKEKMLKFQAREYEKARNELIKYFDKASNLYVTAQGRTNEYINNYYREG